MATKNGKAVTLLSAVKFDKHRRIEIPEAPDDNGNPSVAFIRSLTVSEAMEYSQVVKNSANDEGNKDMTPLYDLLSKSIVDEGGKRQLTSEQVSQLPMPVFTALVTALSQSASVTKEGFDQTGKDSN